MDKEIDTARKEKERERERIRERERGANVKCRFQQWQPKNLGLSGTHIHCAKTLQGIGITQNNVSLSFTCLVLWHVPEESRFHHLKICISFSVQVFVICLKSFWQVQVTSSISPSWDLGSKERRLSRQDDDSGYMWALWQWLHAVLLRHHGGQVWVQTGCWTGQLLQQPQPDKECSDWCTLCQKHALTKTVVHVVPPYATLDNPTM